MKRSNKSKKILVTGGTGLVGSTFVKNFKEKFSISTIGRDNVDLKINLISKKEVLDTFERTDADFVVNFAAYTNVDGAEDEKGNKKGEVYILNTMLPLWLSQACIKSGKKLYHISTDYVFDGKQDSRPYQEDDIPIPVNSWYCQTKFWGEVNVQETIKENDHFSIIRISFPYSGTYVRKLDFARTIVDKLKKGEEYLGIIDQKIKPASTDVIANALSFLLEKNLFGIYHVAGEYENEYITPFDFAQKVAEVFNLNPNLIKSISFSKFQSKRITPRPQNTWLNTKKLKNLGFTFSNFDEALRRFKQQLENLPV